ncbi:homogentisate 1,2-dioxygenase [Sphingomonas sp. QA11]|uniref:homogentisate 1,2-dioxygenase n=1 Tax=Sphingomonas sp. QA11 TaxID=2950605 RepID=UPI00234A0051|nr:homogentisate 1,2-dioxygenase [Sphingomonas sp. QA11]WCM29448.1 homogentisate 1,2-dioxygenase [Sphingomonas sp. QA11]
MKSIVMTGLFALAAATGAAAQQAPQQPAARMPMAEAQPVCPRDAAPVPAEFAGWPSRKPMAAAVDSASLANTTLAPGAAVDLALAPTPAVTYALRPSRPGGSVSHGGMATVTISEAGTYRVAIGSAAWLDIVRDGASLESVGHGHGPACSGIRKMVDFTLKPGSYVLQIVGNGATTLPLTIVKLP